MSLTLGRSRLAGDPQRIRADATTMLLWLLPYYTLACIDGFFLPDLMRAPLWFWSYDLLKWLVLPVAYLWMFRQRFAITPATCLYTGERVAYRAWEWMLLALFVSLLLALAYHYVAPFVLRICIALARSSADIAFGVELPDTYSLLYNGRFSFGPALPEQPIMRAATAIWLAATAGIIEEIVFRGLLRPIVSAMPGNL